MRVVTTPEKSMFRAFLLLLALVVPAVMSSCARHESDDAGGSAASPYVVTITSSLPLAPRSELCGYVDETSTQAPAANVQVMFWPPSGGSFAITTDAMGNFCVSPAGRVHNPNGMWDIRADGPLGQSEVLSFESLPYNMEVAISSDSLMNGEEAWMRLVYVDQAENPTTQVVSNSSFKISRLDGTTVAMLQSNGTGLVQYQSQLVPGIYLVQGIDNSSGELSPLREIATLSPSEAALGLSVAGQLDNQGNFLPPAARRWWDIVETEERQLKLKFFISQSAHFGGVVDFVDPANQSFALQVVPGSASLLWTPDAPGDWYASTELLLPTPGITGSLWRRILVLPL
jgi:hypothetical protein